jgi:hypothetical protein
MTTKGPWPAVTAQETIGAHRLRLYRLYDEDALVISWIQGLYERTWPRVGATLRRFPEYLLDSPPAINEALGHGSDDPVQTYLADLRREAGGYGFQWIPRVGSAPGSKTVDATYMRSGVAQVHAYLWHYDKWRLWEARPRTPLVSDVIERPSITSLASFGTVVPDLDTGVLGTTEQWDPRIETRRDATRRLSDALGRDRREIETDLRRFEASGGYRTPDTRTEIDGMSLLDRSAQWTFQRIRHAWTYSEIAKRWHEAFPNQIRFRPPDAEAARWEADHPEQSQSFDSAAAVWQVRKAVTEFGRLAAVRVERGPGRRAR